MTTDETTKAAVETPPLPEPSERGMGIPTPAWVAAIAGITADLDAVRKGQQSKDGYKYRGIDDVINALNPLLAKHSVVILPCLDHWTSDEWVGYNHGANNPWTRTAVVVDYHVVGPDASVVIMRAVGEGIDNSDKGVGKAMSYCYKSCVSQLFAIPTDDPEMDNEATSTREHIPELAGANPRKAMVARMKIAKTHPEWDTYRDQMIDAGVIHPEHGRVSNPITLQQLNTALEILDEMPDAEPVAPPAPDPAPLDSDVVQSDGSVKRTPPEGVDPETGEVVS